MEELLLWQPYLLQFLAAWVRFTAFWPAAPLLGQHVPAWAKIGLSTFLALAVVPMLPVEPEPDGLYALILPLVGETLTGLTLGFAVNMTLAAVFLAGQLMDMPIGFSMAGIFDPNLGIQTPILAQFLRVMMILVLFIVNGHHALIRALTASFEIVPIGGIQFGSDTLQVLLTSFSGLFLLGFRMALPVVAALLLTDIALGIVTRAVPQINVFVIGFPIKIVVGLLVFLFALPALITIIGTLVGAGGQLIETLWRVMIHIGDGP